MRIRLLHSRNQRLVAALAPKLSPGPGPPQDYLTPSPQYLPARPATPPVDFPPPGPGFGVAPVFCLPLSFISHPGAFLPTPCAMHTYRGRGGGGGVLAGRKGDAGLGAEIRQPSPITAVGDSNTELEQGGDPSPKPSRAWGPGLREWRRGPQWLAWEKPGGSVCSAGTPAPPEVLRPPPRTDGHDANAWDCLTLSQFPAA